MVEVKKDLMEMKVAELREELGARGEIQSGNKAWLRRRLHAAIVRARTSTRAPRRGSERPKISRALRAPGFYHFAPTSCPTHFYYYHFAPNGANFYRTPPL